jgi:hypothetical protein
MRLSLEGYFDQSFEDLADREKIDLLVTEEVENEVKDPQISK